MRASGAIVGTTTSGNNSGNASGNGIWERVSEDPGNDTYVASVAKKVIGKGSKRKICQPATSGVLVVTTDDQV
jgi:hypothetical protein